MTQNRNQLRSSDGQELLPSATLRADGSPRFVVPILPQLVAADSSVAHLLHRELNCDGFERMTRDVIDAHLQPGDLFLDIGAHWGTMSLSAVTGPAKGIRAIAVEPSPLNVTMLLRAVAINRVADAMVVVAAAAGNVSSVAELRFGSTMANSIGAQDPARSRAGLQVPVLTVDGLLRDLNSDPERRIVMKVDVEGAEPDVIRGAAQAIESGRVGLIIWERGQDYRANKAIRAKAIEVARWLATLGFRHYAFPYHEWGGPLVPATDDWFFSNIFSFAPTVRKRDLYPQTFTNRPPFEELFRMQRTPERTAEVAEMCIALRSSDAIRWADPVELERGADARAAAAARFVSAGSRVLDVGAGSMALSRHLPPDAQYQPADLMARSEACIVVDLNQEQFPTGNYDVVVLLDALEYIHDADALLRKCASAAPRLIVCYQVLDSDAQERRKRGILSDLTREQLGRALHAAGFDIADDSECNGAVLLNCVKR